MRGDTMDHYLDLTLRPDPEFAQAHLISALFAKLHRGLVSLDANDIGVSFPEHSERPRTLGNVLRLHGTAGRLEHLMATDWLIGMRDHLSQGSITPTPENARHRVVKRVQPKTNPERLRRRHMRRHGVSAEVARERIPDTVIAKVTQPYAQLRSRSTGESFCLFIDHGPAMDQPVKGTFSCYGLSSTATIPWF